MVAGDSANEDQAESRLGVERVDVWGVVDSSEPPRGDRSGG